MKEQIIEEFAEKITDYGFNDEYGYYINWKDGVMPIVEKYANIIIAQTREETIGEAIKQIEEVKDVIRKQTGAFKYDDCYDDCIKILNKLKK